MGIGSNLLSAGDVTPAAAHCEDEVNGHLAPKAVVVEQVLLVHYAAVVQQVQLVLLEQRPHAVRAHETGEPVLDRLDRVVRRAAEAQRLPGQHLQLNI